MAKKRLPQPVMRRRVGAVLRTWREEAEVTPSAAAGMMGWDNPRLSRVEHGVYRVSAEEVRFFASKYCIEEPKSVEEVARAAEQEPGWYAPYAGKINQQYLDYIELESWAAGIRIHHSAIVPGLLQSPSYAREMITRGVPSVSKSEAEMLINIRLARQEILSREQPTQIQALIPESALHARFEQGPGTMRDQIRRLLDVCEMPGITLQVVPLTAHPVYGANGAMTLLDYRKPWMPVASVDSVLGGNHTDEPQNVQVIEEQFAEIASIALPADKSRDVLNEHLEGLH